MECSWKFTRAFALHRSRKCHKDESAAKIGTISASATEKQAPKLGNEEHEGYSPAASEANEERALAQPAVDEGAANVAVPPFDFVFCLPCHPQKYSILDLRPRWMRENGTQEGYSGHSLVDDHSVVPDWQYLMPPTIPGQTRSPPFLPFRSLRVSIILPPRQTVLLRRLKRV